jgi:ornithine cyclodeaminase
LATQIHNDFTRWPEFEKTARVANHSDIGVIELMPVSDATRYAFKYVNGHPANTAKGLYTVMAFGVLAEVETGYPVLLSELTLATALRTCATSLMAARALARPDAKRMALIGNGAQSEFQALAFHYWLGINEIVVFDVDSAATDKLMYNLSTIPNLRVVRAANTAQAVKGADIVTTVTADKNYATIITPDMLEPGMHLNAVGGDCPGKTELHADVLRAGRVFGDFPVVDLWKVLTGTQAGRQHNEQITIFDSVGFALEDYSTLRFIHEQALRHSIGADVELVPETTNPKDLFCHTRRQAGRIGLRRVA